MCKISVHHLQYGFCSQEEHQAADQAGGDSQPSSQQNDPAGMHITTWQGHLLTPGINIRFFLPGGGHIPRNFHMGTGI